MIRLWILVMFVAMSPVTVYAYIDLGTGSMITQLIIASIAGILLFVKDIWRSIYNFLSGKKKNDDK